MDGVFLFWFGWIAWAIVTFLIPKTKERFWLAFFILILIILIPHKLTIAGYHVNVAFMFAIFYCCIQLRNLAWYSLCYAGLVSCIIASAFASYHLIILYDPVIRLYDSKIVISVIVFAMTYLTFSTWSKRFLVTITGLLQGEWMYSMIVNKLFMLETIGSLYFFDILALCLAVNSIVWFIQLTTLRLSAFLQQKKNAPAIEA